MAPAEESDTWLEASRRFYADCSDTELCRFINAKKGIADATNQRAELIQQLEVGGDSTRQRLSRVTK